MRDIAITALKIGEIRVLRYGRFSDYRGYFTETFRKSELVAATAGAVGSWEIVQANESFSRKGTLRGLHFQWNPSMGKLVRTVYGHMVDLALDIRVGSPTFGHIIAYDMPADSSAQAAEWIWIPPGFAHGNFFVRDSVIEYLCSGEYNGKSEAGISPLSKDIDWSLCDIALRARFDEIAGAASLLISDKDRGAPTVSEWRSDERAGNFPYRREP